jgi:transcriptional regulator with XRE-family HTH domain
MSKIRIWRDKVGLSQRQLATLLEVSQQTVSNLEAGRQNLTSELVAKLLARYPLTDLSEDLGITIVPSFEVKNADTNDSSEERAVSDQT